MLAGEAPVDLITTDAMMPRLRANLAQQHVPVLMLTAWADEAYRLAARTVGVDEKVSLNLRSSLLGWRPAAA